MRNLLLSLLVACLFFALFKYGMSFNTIQTLIPLLIIFPITYFLLSRKTGRDLQPEMLKAQKAFMSQNFELGMNILEKAKSKFGPQQFGVKSSIDSQIGMLYFQQKKYDKALQRLENASGFTMGPEPSMMLSVIYYKRKKYDDMRKTLEIAVSRGKKKALAWNLKGYLENQIGEKEIAIKTIQSGIKATSDDIRLQEALLALQNNKKMKMAVYKDEWYMLGLDAPPRRMQKQVGFRQKISKQQRRGR